MAENNISRAEANHSSLESCHCNGTMGYIARSTFAQSPAAFGLDLSNEIIVLTPYVDITEYQGTRAALEAEGVIPSDIKWPEGFDDLYWNDDKFSYWLCRKRPDGITGQRKQFLDLDWWMFRCDPLDVNNLDSQVARMAKDLAGLIHRQSAEGHAEWIKQWDRYFKAQNDEKFQAFKSLIPGINRPKRGRPRKNAEQSSEERKSIAGES